MKPLQILCVTFLAFINIGCQDSAEKRHRVSGTVTFEGTPVVGGEIVFTPDGSKGNSGLQGIAKIKDGKFDTMGTRAPGCSPGPTVATVTGWKDDKGTVIAEGDFPIELPASDSEQSFNLTKDMVPRKADINF